MAYQSILQQRQQEIHRPFQPLSTTIGREGKAIAEPQEKYAGWWNPIEDISGRLASLYERTGRKKDEEDPQETMAQDLYSQASFDIQNQMLDWTKQDQEDLEYAAAAKGQTSSEYLKNIYDKEVQAKAVELGIPPRKLMKARQAYYNAEIKGLETTENRQYEQTKAVTNEIIKDGYGIADSNGNIDLVATRQKAAAIMEANELKDATFDKGVGARLGFTLAEYNLANKEQQRQMDDQIANFVFSDIVNPLLSVDIESVVKAVNSGAVKDLREGALMFKSSLQSAIQQINQSNDVTAGAKQRLIADVENISKYIEELEKQPDVQLKDLKNAMEKTTLLMKAAALNDKGAVGLITRTSAVLPPELANYVIEVVRAKSPKLFQLAEDVESLDPVLRTLALTPAELRQYGYIGGNIANILEGKSPEYGTNDDKIKSRAIASKYLQQSIVNPDKVTPQQRMEMTNVTSYMLNMADKALRKDPDVQGVSGEAYANIVKWAADDKGKGLFVLNNDIRNKTIEIGNSVADSYLLYPTGPAGVLRNTTPTDDRWVAYDEASNSFVGGKAMFSGGTSGWAFNPAVEEINNAFKAKVTFFELENNKEATAEDKKQIANDVIKLLVAANVDLKMFKSFTSSSEVKKKITPSTYKGNIDLISRPVVRNPDNSISTERSITIEEDGKYINIPTIVKGRLASDEEAIDYYHKTKAHLGIFDTLEEATKNANEIHKMQEKRYSK